MIHSLASHVEKPRYDQELLDSFGLVIIDEIHRSAAETWAPVASMFKAAWRIALSATPRRKDGAENVFFYNVGEITYAAKTFALVPKLRKLVTGAKLKKVGKIPFDQMKKPMVLAQLCSDKYRTRMIADDVAVAVRNGRKIMVVSERLSHLQDIAAELTQILMSTKELPFTPKLDFYTGDWFTGEYDEAGEPKKKKRTEDDLLKAESANVVFATVQLVEEGLDIQALDVIVLATPISDVEQTAGRGRRRCLPEPAKCERLCAWRAGVCTGKPMPIIVDVQDPNVPLAVRSAKNRSKFWKEIGCGD